MKKYFWLHWAFFRASFAADIEYRLNIFLHVCTDIMWYTAQILTFEVIYRQTPTLGSWTLEKTRIFLGILFIVDALYMVFLQENLNHLGDGVRKGQLDLLLVKPVNSQFMVSCRKLGVAYIINLGLASTWLFWAIHRYSEPLPAARILWLLFLIPSGVMILYGMRFIFAAVTVITVRADNLQYLWYQIYRLGMRPDTIYTPWMKFFVLAIVPMGLIASVPSRALLEEPNYGLFLWSLVVGALSLYASARFWKYALRHYSSASS